MLKTTIDALRAVLNTDPSMTPDKTRRAIAAIQAADAPPMTQQADATKPIMSAREAARLLGLTTRTVRRLAKEGHITPLKLPGRKTAFGYDGDTVRALLSDKRSA